MNYFFILYHLTTSTSIYYKPFKCSIKPIAQHVNIETPVFISILSIWGVRILATFLYNPYLTLAKSSMGLHACSDYRTDYTFT